MADEQGTEERKRYVVGVVKIPFEQRDLAHRVITDDDPRNFLDVIGADEPDDHDEFPVGANTTYAVDLTEAEAAEFLTASNVRYVEEDVRTWPVDTVTPGPAGTPDPPARADTVTIPTAQTQTYMRTRFGASPQWHGRDVPICVLDQGSTAASRAQMGQTLVARAYFGGTPAGGAELFSDPSDPSGYFSHGCLTCSEAVPVGGKLIDAVVVDSSGGSSAALLAAGAKWAITNYGAKVLSYSFSVGGGGGASSAWTDLFVWMQSYDAQIYIAAGNDNRAGIDYPAAYSTSYSNVHSVGAFDETTDAKADFSNYSANLSGVNSGVNVAGLTPSGALTTASGTSMATPHSAQLCARIQTGGRFTAQQAAAALDSNTRNTGQPATYQGHGAYSLQNALTALGAISAPVVREVVSTNAFSTAISVSTSSAVQAGDALVIFHTNDFGAYGAAGTDCSAPGAMAFQIGGDAGVNNAHIYVYTSVLSVGGVQTITAHNPGSYSSTLHVYVLKQWSSYDAGAAILDTSLNTQQSTPDFYANASDCIFIGSWATKPSATYTAPSGMTLRTQQGNGGNTSASTATKLLGNYGQTNTGYAGLSVVPNSNQIAVACTVSGGTVPAAVNTAPTANAGADTSAVSGATVSLSGTASDAEGLASAPYAWTVVSDGGTGLTNASITNRLTASPSFVAPTVTANAAITLRLTVTDAGGLTATDDVVVTVTPTGTGGGGTGTYPTLVGTAISPNTAITTSGAVNVTTASFTPNVGELLVVKATATWSGMTINSVTGGGLTWTRRVQNTGSSNSPATMWTAIAASATATTVTVNFSSTQTFNEAAVLVERWSGGAMAVTPATNAGTYQGPLSSSITPTSPSSVITWVVSDYGTTQDTGTPVPKAGTIEAYYRETGTSANYGSLYFGWQQSTGVSSQSYGLSTPASQSSGAGTATALEIIPGSTTVTYSGTVTLAGAGGLTANATNPTSLVAHLVSTSSVVTDGYATTAGGLPRFVAQTSTAASCFLKMKLDAITMTSPTTVGSVVAVVASAAPMVSSSSLVADCYLSTGLSANLTGSGAASLVSADSYVVPAEGTAIVSPTVASALAQLEMPEAATLTASTSLAADPTSIITFTADAPTVLTAATSVVADSVLSMLASVSETAGSSLTAEASRFSSLSATLTSSTSVFVIPEGQTWLGSLVSTVTANAENTTSARAVLTASTTVTSATFATISVQATLQSASTTVASVYADRPMAATTVSATFLTADTGAVIKVGQAVMTASSMVVTTPLVQAPGAVFLTASTTWSAVLNQNTPVFFPPTGPAPILFPTQTTRLMVANTVDGKIGWELPYSDLGWSSTLNKVGSFSATLLVEDALDSLNDQGVLDPRAELRGILSGPRRLSYVLTYGESAVWAGPMQPSVDIEGTKQQVKVGASDIGSMMQTRLLTGFTSPSGGDYAAADRDVTFAGTTPAGALLKVVQHAISTSGGRSARALPIYCLNPPNALGEETFTYLSYDLVDAWKAISDIAARDDGPDFRFRPWVGFDTAGVARLWYDLQIGSPYLTASGVPDDRGESAWTFDDETSVVTRQNDGVDMTTTLFMAGGGQDREKLIARASSDYLTGLGFPAMERADTSHTSQTELLKLQAAANGALQAHELPTETWTVSVPRDSEPTLGSYLPGDLARLEVFRHALIEPGVYKRRITGLSGDSSSKVKVTCAVEDAAMAGG